MRTYPLPVLSRVKRVLCGLSRFNLFASPAPLPPAKLSLAEGEEPLGIYYNEEFSISQAIVITSQSLHLESGGMWQRLPYSSIAKVVTPESKVDIRGLRLLSRDGIEVWLPVLGGTEKTSDAFEFLRFINRVIADRHPAIR
jgi:hypothetical protein